MRAIEFPPVGSYSEEGSEVGDVERSIRRLRKEVIGIFPEQLPELDRFLERWTWMGLDNCHQLQLAAEAVLDGHTRSLRFSLNKDDSVTGIIERLGDTAPESDEDDMDLYWEGPTVPHLRIELTQETTTAVYETRSAPNSWTRTSTSKNQEDQTYYFGEWEDHPGELARHLRYLLPKTPVETAKSIELERVIPADDARKLMGQYWEMKGLSGIGADEDERMWGALATRLATASGLEDLIVLTQMAHVHIYGHGTGRRQANGEYKLTSNVDTFELEAPDGLLIWSQDSWGKKHVGWSLDGQPIEADDSRFGQWAAAMNSGTWQQVKD